MNDWTRKELDEALDAAQNEVSDARQRQAIKFCRSLLASQFPKANEIIVRGTKMKLLPEYVERAAAALAEVCNGGKWASHYTESQREVWRNRIKSMEDHNDA